MKLLRTTAILIVASGLIQIYSCGSRNNRDTADSNQKEQNCMDYIIAQDDSLGRIRNHASETVSLSESIEQYVSTGNELNFEHCPSEFTHAFKNHLNAWTEMQTVTDNYPDLRGEMHILFDTIAEGEHKTRFKASLEKIHNTWKDVEKAHKSANK